MGLFTTEKRTEIIKDRLVPYEKTVHEYRAPTDQSIVIANEYFEKAKQNLIGNYVIESTTLKAAILAFRDDVSVDTINIHAKFNLNGNDHTIQFNVGREEYRNLESNPGGKNLIIQILKDKLAKEISKQMLAANTEFKIAILKHTK